MYMHVECSFMSQNFSPATHTTLFGAVPELHPPFPTRHLVTMLSVEQPGGGAKIGRGGRGGRATSDDRSGATADE